MLQEIGLSVFEAQVVQHLRIRMDVEDSYDEFLYAGSSGPVGLRPSERHKAATLAGFSSAVHCSLALLRDDSWDAIVAK